MALYKSLLVQAEHQPGLAKQGTGRSPCTLSLCAESWRSCDVCQSTTVEFPQMQRMFPTLCRDRFRHSSPCRSGTGRLQQCSSFSCVASMSLPQWSTSQEVPCLVVSEQLLDFFYRLTKRSACASRVAAQCRLLAFCPNWLNVRCACQVSQCYRSLTLSWTAQWNCWTTALALRGCHGEGQRGPARHWPLVLAHRIPNTYRAEPLARADHFSINGILSFRGGHWDPHVFGALPAHTSCVAATHESSQSLWVKLDLLKIAKFSATTESELAESSDEAESAWSSASDTISTAAAAVAKSGGEARTDVFKLNMVTSHDGYEFLANNLTCELA